MKRPTGWRRRPGAGPLRASCATGLPRTATRFCTLLRASPTTSSSTATRCSYSYSKRPGPEKYADRTKAEITGANGAPFYVVLQEGLPADVYGTGGTDGEGTD